MTIYDSIIDEKLQQFLDSAPSQKLVVIKSNIERNEAKSLDLGNALASHISHISRENEMAFQFRVEEVVNKAIKNAIFEDEVFGPSVILSNPGILFEKPLHLNVCSLLKRISKNVLVILLWQGEVSANRICFLSEESGLYINQSDINYCII